MPVFKPSNEPVTQSTRQGSHHFRRGARAEELHITNISITLRRGHVLAAVVGSMR